MVDIPVIDPHGSALDAALAYAAAGLYVGPVAYREKDPGSLLKRDWPQKTSRDPEVIRRWYAVWPDAGVFIHAGRSGLVVFDVDTPANLHPLIREANDECKPPRQTTRADDPEKSHYLFRVPEGRSLGNSVGKLNGGWGQVRGKNGVIIVAPSTHEKDDGLYVWQQTGEVPELPAYLAEQLPDAHAAADAATDAEVEAFLEAHSDPGTDPGLLDVHCTAFEKKVDAGESRHDSMVGHLVGAMKDAALGLYDARAAADTLESLFMGAVTVGGHGEQGEARSLYEASNEWAGMLAWAVAQAKATDPDRHRAELQAKGLLSDPSKDFTSSTGGGLGHDLHDAYTAEAAAKGALADCRWSKGLGWMRFNGRVWEPVSDAAIIELLRQWFVRCIDEEARQGAKVERLRALSSLLSGARIRSIAGLCRGVLEAKDTDYDSHSDLLNVWNGIVDLRTGALRPHDPELLLTKITRTRYVPGARSDDWDATLAALPPEVRHWMQLRLGQAATGHPTPDDILPVCQGGGENGKTTFFGAVRRALGDHAVAVPERALLANPSDHPTELMTLRGARLAIIEETPEARHLSVKRLKDTVGADVMTARYIRQDSVQWTPTHSLFVTSNYTPRVDETDHGTWRRLALVKFPYKFVADGPLVNPNDRRGDPTLRQRVTTRAANLEAVLAWVVEGALRWYADGRVLPPRPTVVEQDTAAWRGEADLVYAYAAERLVLDPGYHVPSKILFEDFNDWLIEQGHRPWSDQTFGVRLRDHEQVGARGVAKVSRAPKDSTLSLPMHVMKPYGTYKVWAGMRFRRPGEGDQ